MVQKEKGKLRHQLLALQVNKNKKLKTKFKIRLLFSKTKISTSANLKMSKKFSPSIEIHTLIEETSIGESR